MEGQIPSSSMPKTPLYQQNSAQAISKGASKARESSVSRENSRPVIIAASNLSQTKKIGSSPAVLDPNHCSTNSSWFTATQSSLPLQDNKKFDWSAAEYDPCHCSTTSAQHGSAPDPDAQWVDGRTAEFDPCICSTPSSKSDTQPSSTKIKAEVAKKG